MAICFIHDFPRWTRLDVFYLLSWLYTPRKLNCTDSIAGSLALCLPVGLASRERDQTRGKKRSNSGFLFPGTSVYRIIIIWPDPFPGGFNSILKVLFLICHCFRAKGSQDNHTFLSMSPRLCPYPWKSLPVFIVARLKWTNLGVPTVSNSAGIFCSLETPQFTIRTYSKSSVYMKSLTFMTSIPGTVWYWCMEGVAPAQIQPQAHTHVWLSDGTSSQIFDYSEGDGICFPDLPTWEMQSTLGWVGHAPSHLQIEFPHCCNLFVSSFLSDWGLKWLGRRCSLSNIKEMNVNCNDGGKAKVLWRLHLCYLLGSYRHVEWRILENWNVSLASWINYNFKTWSY